MVSYPATPAPPFPRAQRIRPLLRQRGLTQRALAAQLGVTQQAISRWEQGHDAPHPESRRRLAALLDLTPEALTALTGWPLPPPAATVAEPAPQVTSLVGQAALLAELTDRLSERQSTPRLLSLVGPPGIGKSRLVRAAVAAVQAAPRSNAPAIQVIGFPAIAATELPAALDPADRLFGTIATTMGLDPTPGRPLASAIRHALRDQRLWLVLDGFESVHGARDALIALLEACPWLRILVTTQVRLAIGEQELRVLPLATPALPAAALAPLLPLATRLQRIADHLRHVPGWESYPAIQLFVDRARAADQHFVLDATTGPAVAAICHRLQGLPLDLELAAAQCFDDPPAAILADLEREPYVAPAGLAGAGSILGRSYELLAPVERWLLRVLATLPGGFTKEIAHDLIAAVSPPSALDLPPAARSAVATAGLATLSRHSLIVRLPHPHPAYPHQAAVRYRMLDSVRGVGLAALDAQGEAATVRQAVADVMIALATRAEAAFGTPDDVAWLEQLDHELDNLRAALRWSIEFDAGHRGLVLAGLLWWFWDTRNHYDEGRAWLASALAATNQTTGAAYARAKLAAGVLAYRQGDAAAALAHLPAALAEFRRLGLPAGETRATAFLGLAAELGGDLDAAAAWHAQATEIATTAGLDFLRAGSLGNQGEVELARGNLTAAAAVFEAAFTGSLATGNQLLTARARHNLGRVAFRRDQLTAAERFFRECLAQSWGLGDQRSVAIALESLAATIARQGDPARAAGYLGTAAAMREMIGAPPLVQYRTEQDQALTEIKGALGAERFAGAFLAGRERAWDEVIAELLPAAAT